MYCNGCTTIFKEQTNNFNFLLLYCCARVAQLLISIMVVVADEKTTSLNKKFKDGNDKQSWSYIMAMHAGYIGGFGNMWITDRHSNDIHH